MGRVTELRRDKVDKQREYKIVSDDIRVLENEVKRIELEMEEKKIPEDKDGFEKKAEGNGDNEESEPPSKSQRPTMTSCSVLLGLRSRTDRKLSRR